MAFNINSFKSNLQDYGYLKTNQFEVLVTPPPILFSRNLNILGTPFAVGRVLYNTRFRIEQVNVPGISLISSDISRYGVGPTQKQPFNAQYQDVTFSILVDGYADAWQFWYNWIRTIYQFNGKESTLFGLDGANPTPNYTAEYKDRYSSVMQIVIYDNYGNAIQRVNLYEAFPSSLRPVSMTWGNGDLIRLAVSITYSSYTIVGSTLEGFLENAVTTVASEVLNRINL
jgi:hypothetical protein